MRVDEGWADQIAAGIDGGFAGIGQAMLDRDDTLAPDADIDILAPIGQAGVAHDQVEHGITFPPCDRESSGPGDSRPAAPS